ncbi:MAG: class I SAM-dependent methyltransferase [Chloroflexia bacterium]|nr:class I SAM-dependent methyltransferase [Chloroflexia bacterium]
MSDISFDETIAPYYESWFETPAGKQAARREKALLQRLLATLGPPGTLLEIGCGTGYFSRWLAELGWQVTGLDLSLSMLWQARSRGELPLVLGDALALPCPDNSFEVVAIITALEFFRDAPAALEQAWRVARRGLLLGVLNRLGPLAWLRRVQGKLRPNIYSEARFYSPGELHSLVEESGGPGLDIHWDTTVWPRWLPLEGGPLPWGAFIGLAARDG